MKALCALFLIPLLQAAEPSNGPLKVFILAGQSNMEGHARIETFDYIGDDPATAPLLKEMRGPDGEPVVADDVWISYLTGGPEGGPPATGKLTAGYGARSNPAESDGKIGPEFTFGLTMGKVFGEPVLLIKSAWGGKSLFYDFRPPGAGVYPRTEDDIANDRNPADQSGHYYRLMIGHVRRVLAELPEICPDYDPERGHELAGFVWFQGFNDMVNGDVYPSLPADSAGNRFAKYGDWLAELIRDTRRDLDAPELPFVIGVMGVGGEKADADNLKFREAMAAPAAMPEFRGNVAAVATAPFWDEPLARIQDKKEQVSQMEYLLSTKNENHPNKDGTMSEDEQQAYLREFEAELISDEEAALLARGASNAGYHYLGCAKTFARMGRAFAEALLELRAAGPEAEAER